MNPDELARALTQPGRASISYLDRYSPERPLVLECFRPQTWRRRGLTPPVFNVSLDSPE